MSESDVRIPVRLSQSTAESVEAAAKSENIPVSTWIRNQIVASLYLAGVQSAPKPLPFSITAYIFSPIASDTQRGSITRLKRRADILGS